MMRGMNREKIIAIICLTLFLVVAWPNISEAYVPDEGPEPPDYGYDFNLKYTDSSYNTISGTLQDPVSLGEQKQVSFTFDASRTTNTSDYRCVRWFIETPKNSISWSEISALGSCEGTSPSNHKLYKKTAAGLTLTYDIAVNNYDGAALDDDTPYAPPTTPSTPTPSAPGTTQEEALYPLQNSGVTYKMDNPSWHTVFQPDNVDTYEEWLMLVWNWSMGIMIPLSVLILSAAGVIYTISEGDSNRIGIAKKMIMGVVSGVGILVLSRLLFIIILGEQGATQWFIFF
jgi:hypothetical protein